MLCDIYTKTIIKDLVNRSRCFSSSVINEWRRKGGRPVYGYGLGTAACNVAVNKFQRVH
jgi:hypothetical protein